MLIVYDKNSGQVLDNSGTCSATPSGPVGEQAFVNTDARGLDRDALGLLRLHDVTDRDLVQLVMDNFVHVDAETGSLVFEGPLPKLSADRDSISADAATPAAVTYESGRAPAEVVFDVNGATETVAVTDGTAQLEVVAEQPGPITVTCQGLTVTITATEAPA